MWDVGLAIHWSVKLVGPILKGLEGVRASEVEWWSHGCKATQIKCGRIPIGNQIKVHFAVTCCSVESTLITSLRHTQPGLTCATLFILIQKLSDQKPRNHFAGSFFHQGIAVKSRDITWRRAYARVVTKPTIRNFDLRCLGRWRMKGSSASQQNC